ncbi:hypothetical protein [Candidatus Symbiopectobacterium sp.]|uniref:hypothetical protein n=1 Tax=Candidatus Symbiopectobacterium sp. TaxID=2816440 RepID=UPI0025BFB3D8|nr:hypothetical protein [Candidatus Symbiopectobacterium sp.]
MRGSVVSLGCQHKIYLFNKASLLLHFCYPSSGSLCCFNGVVITLVILAVNPFRDYRGYNGCLEEGESQAR